MSSKRVYNRQQSVSYTSPSNCKSSRNLKIDKPPTPCHTDFIPENKKTSNEMIYREHLPDLIDRFEGRAPSGNLYFDGLWTGQFFRAPKSECDDDESEWENQESMPTLGGVHTYSRGVSACPNIKNRHLQFQDDPPSSSSHSTAVAHRPTMLLQERYDDAIRKTFERGYTQEMLLKRMRSKLSEKIETYGAHRIRLRKKFQCFDKESRGALYEWEFKELVDMTNCYFDEIESLALFAYLDEEGTGLVSWKSFEQHCMVRDLSSGGALQPKAITHQM